MSTTKHTPEPDWKIEGAGFTKGEAAIVEGNDTVCYVNCGSPVNGTPKGQRRARLIAAAPELLEACKAIVQDLREARDTGACGRSRDSQIADIAAAIAKAEGR